jgi:hypothetical protein
MGDITKAGPRVRARTYPLFRKRRIAKRQVRRFLTGADRKT